MDPKVQPDELDATQTAILDAVLVCIVNYGFGGLTTRRIAVEAGVNEVTIFRRFGNKTTLLNAALQREASLVQADAVHYSGDLTADLRRIVATLWQAASRRQSILPLLVAEIPRNPELQAAAQSSLQVIQQIVQILERYQTQGQLRPEPPILTFAALIGPIMFINLIGHMQPAALDAFQTELYVQHFLAGRRVTA